MILFFVIEKHFSVLTQSGIFIFNKIKSTGNQAIERLAVFFSYKTIIKLIQIIQKKRFYILLF